MVCARAARGCLTAALHTGSIGGKHGGAEAVSARASLPLLVAALMCSYIQLMGPAADLWGGDFRTLLRISPATVAGGVSGVGTGVRAPCRGTFRS
jgi:hypothetical protein